LVHAADGESNVPGGFDGPLSVPSQEELYVDGQGVEKASEVMTEDGDHVVRLAIVSGASRVVISSMGSAEPVPASTAGGGASSRPPTLGAGRARRASRTRLNPRNHL
jgi:hypothetical protein